MLKSPSAYGKKTPAQLRKELQAGDHSLDELRDMLRAAWAVPTGSGDPVAEEVWKVILRAASAGGASAPREASETELLNALRSTFTAEAEVLARWGVTPALPQELRDLVFKGWGERISDDPDAMGRSKGALERDLEKVRREAELRRSGTKS